MINRWIGILSLFFMILANAAIIWRDILPDWVAGDPPPSPAQLLGPGEEQRVQVGIYRHGTGRQVGTSWTRSRRTGDAGLVMVITHTKLEPITLPGGIVTPQVLVETELTFRPDEARVDELDFQMKGLGMPIALHGEAMPTGEFPFRWQVGARRGEIALDSRAPAALGDVIRPFQRLPNLYVGRSWRLELLDPLKHLLPQIQADDVNLQSVLIRVTGRERIEHRGVELEAFVVEVEDGSATAWVAPSGVVLRQEINVPFLGRLVLLDEEYDERARLRAINAIMNAELARDEPETGDSDAPDAGGDD